MIFSELGTRYSQSSSVTPENSSRSSSPSSKRQRLNPSSESQGSKSSQDGYGYNQSTSQNVLSKNVTKKQCMDDSVYKCAAEIIEEAKPLSCLVTKVSGIDDRLYNSSGAIDITGPSSLNKSCLVMLFKIVPFLLNSVSVYMALFCLNIGIY